MERIRYFNVETLSDLSKVKFSGDPGDTTYFTYSDTTLRQGAPDVAWHGVCTVAPVGQVYSHGKFYFPGRSGYSGTVYGVQWDTTDPSPECSRIGNLSLHATLPVQAKMVGGTMADDGTFTEFSDQGDWTGEVRDGSIGQVMVRIPTFWIKFETWGDVYKVLMSAVPVVGFAMVKEMFVSAYEASLDRTDLKLSSVANTSARYRGGNNNSSWDAEDTAGQGGESHRSLLGRPATGISLTDFRTYARKRGSTAWNCHFYLMQKTLYWLYVVEYATLNSQKVFNAALDANGFHQGGLGDGVSTWDGTSWNNFNGYYPLVPCGWTDSLGNGSGVRNYTVYDAAGAALKTFAVPRYRGIENPWGHIWKHTDGILCQVYSGTDGVSQVYATDDPADFSSTSYSAYRLIGNELRVQQYVSQLHLGENGDITAKAGGGNSTSYYCDYHYCNVENTALRAVLFGGNSHIGSRAGLVYSNSHYAPSVTNASVGSRLCYFDAWKDVVYEEHEWLKGDGEAYIDTGITVPAEKFVCVTKLRNREMRTVPNSFLAFTVRQEQSAVLPFVSVNPRTDEQRYYVDLTYPRSYVPFGSGTFDINITMPSASTLQGDLMFFRSKNLTFGNSPWIGDIAAFLLTSLDSTFRVEMQPCRLLRPIPATLDANGIARDAGECGMWDKVSNKFYGNVASTGRFTVEGYRLYEEFDWLCGRNGAYIDTTYHPIVGTDVFSVHFRYDGTTRNPDNGEQDAFGANYIVSDQRNFIRAFINSGNKLSCSYYEYAGTWPTTGEYSKEWDIANLMIDGSDFKYVANGTAYTFVNNDMQQQTCPVSLFVFKNNDTVYNQNCYLHGDIAFFKITDTSSNVKMHLVPVRLLRPLPAYMDANGKPRAAGECGMWDKVSNKFYGNVASTGRFTVLNN